MAVGLGSLENRISTGIAGFDEVIDMMRWGDNVVWQVQSLESYRLVVDPFVRRCLADGRRLVYIRFGKHAPLLDENTPAVTYQLDPSAGFEACAFALHNIIAEEGEYVFYVFDNLTDLLENWWYSDLMIGNFFRVTCPFLYKLKTITYFAIMRNSHTHSTIVRIRDTTQLLLDLYSIDGGMYIHPLKVWERYSPTMFFPHLIEGDKAICITASDQATLLFSRFGWNRQMQDFWTVTIEQAQAALGQGPEEQAAAKSLLLRLIVGKEARMLKLCEKYFTLPDLLLIALREVGTGLIGGKSVGMLIARKILETDAPATIGKILEPHDSYYLGADIFYTYIVQNGWWELRMRQKKPEGYFALAEELRQNLLTGEFHVHIREQFMQMLEYFGQSPIIVRSSSLLEDNFGNAFAGKYESVFCPNQGAPQARYEAFEQAVRTVYASSMSPDALAYRKSRGLVEKDEQMAILVQRVSGDHYTKYFFPHIAGVANSANLYVWDKEMNPEAGMLRLVVGLGTHAVDRVSGDYVRLVPLDAPLKGQPINYGDEKKFSQHRADVLDLQENLLTSVSVDDIAAADIRMDKTLVFSPDRRAQAWLDERGRNIKAPPIPDFRKLLGATPFPARMKEALTTLERAYDYPVDVEFTANFNQRGDMRVNLLQCRPLQTRGLGRALQMPTPRREDTFFEITGNFMGGNMRIAFDYVIFIQAVPYLELSEREKYEVARLIGRIGERLKGKHILLAGPGRWGTTTASLGVPVQFVELADMAAICEIAYEKANLMPELSFGSHFFQDLVESGIFYAAIFDGREGTLFRPELITAKPNELTALLPEDSRFAAVAHVAATPGLELYSDIVSQRVVCYASSAS